MVVKLLLLASYIALVLTNTSPVIPTQTYPIFQQNVYPSANQPNEYAPYMQSMTAQNQPTHNMSPSSIQPAPSVNQLNEYTPYLQSMTAQNQSPSMNLSPSSIRQVPSVNQLNEYTPYIQSMMTQNQPSSMNILPPSIQQVPYANQLSEYTPYLQSMMAQNQSPSINLSPTSKRQVSSVNQPNEYTAILQSPTAYNQPMNLSPSSIRQLLLNRLLTSPAVQTALDSSFKGYGSNFEFPTNQMVPNHMNNYLEPTEYLNNITNVIKENKVNDIKTKTKPKQNHKRKSSKPRKKHNGVENTVEISNKTDVIHDGSNQNVNNTIETPKGTRKSSPKRTSEVKQQDNATKSKEKENSSNTRKKKRKNKDDETHGNPIDEVNKVENEKLRKRHKKPNKVSTESNIPKQQKIVNTTSRDIKENVNLAPLNEAIVEENIKLKRNLNNEENDYQKALPQLPEEISKNFLSRLPKYENPILSNFFANYENIYQSMLPSKTENTDNKSKKRRKPKRSRKGPRRRMELKNRNFTEEAAILADVNIPKVDIKTDVITTEKTIYYNKITQMTNEPKDENFKLLDQTEIEERAMKVFENEEFRDGFNEDLSKDFGPNDDTYYGYVDDYYPLFTDNAAYNANIKEVYVKNLDDNKYYYELDKNKVKDFINQGKFEDHVLPERIIKDYERNKQYDDIENKNINKNHIENNINEETVFRSPPLLESPDFQTRKIDRSEIERMPESQYSFIEIDVPHRFVGDKSGYSEAKTPHYTGNKHNGIKDRSHKDVETVFAKSKVVRYNPVYSSGEDVSYVRSRKHDWKDESYFEDGETAYVIAESLDYPETFW